MTKCKLTIENVLAIPELEGMCILDIDSAIRQDRLALPAIQENIYYHIWCSDTFELDTTAWAVCYDVARILIKRLCIDQKFTSRLYSISTKVFIDNRIRLVQEFIWKHLYAYHGIAPEARWALLSTRNALPETKEQVDAFFATWEEIKKTAKKRVLGGEWRLWEKVSDVGQENSMYNLYAVFHCYHHILGGE